MVPVLTGPKMHEKDMFKEIKKATYQPLFESTKNYFEIPTKFIPYDMAILELKSKLEWSDNVKPACFPTREDQKRDRDPYRSALMVRFH